MPSPMRRAGAVKDDYEKFFASNAYRTLSLTSAVVSEIADPSGLITFGLETTLDASGGATDRRTAPGGTTFDNAAKNVANSQNHSAGAGQGIWLKLALPAGQAAGKEVYEIEEAGESARSGESTPWPSTCWSSSRARTCFTTCRSRPSRAGTVITSILEVRVDNLGQVPGSAALTLVSQAFSGQTVQLRLKDGDDGERYRVTARWTFDNGDELEAEGELQVRDIQ